MALLCKQTSLDIESKTGYVQLSCVTHLVGRLSSWRGVFTVRLSSSVGHVLQILFGMSFSNAKTLQPQDECNLNLRRDSITVQPLKLEYVGAVWRQQFSPSLGVTAPTPSPCHNSECCSSEWVQPSDRGNVLWKLLTQWQRFGSAKGICRGDTNEVFNTPSAFQRQQSHECLQRQNH